MRGQSVNRLGGLSWPKPRRPALLPNSRPLKCCRSMPDYPGLEPEQQQPSNTPSRASLPPTGHTADPRSNTSPTSGAPCDSPVSRVGCPVSGPKCRVSNVAWEVGAVINYTPSTPLPCCRAAPQTCADFPSCCFFSPISRACTSLHSGFRGSGSAFWPWWPWPGCHADGPGFPGLGLPSLLVTLTPPTLSLSCAALLPRLAGRVCHADS